jgi:hypothetical protein
MSGQTHLPNRLRWAARRILPPLLFLVLALAAGIAAPSRVLLWTNGYHATPEELGLHHFQQDILGNSQHHRVPIGAADTLRSALPGLYSGAGFLSLGDPSSEIALLSLAPLIALLLVRARPARARGGAPLISLFPPEPPPKLLS